MVSIALFSHMARQVLAKLIQWKVAWEIRYYNFLTQYVAMCIFFSFFFFVHRKCVSVIKWDFFIQGGDLPAEAGVIPRAVRQIFDILEAQNADYNMKVTFLELYNEEITDLLSPDENSRPTEEKQKKPITLMEDGKGCVFVRGLEEESVYSVNEIYTLLERGASKRRTAETLLNKRSRSFSFIEVVEVFHVCRSMFRLMKCYFGAAVLIQSSPLLCM